jgi:sulfur relay (sulfurtransferase) DsrC/TusE family protein
VLFVGLAMRSGTTRDLLGKIGASSFVLDTIKDGYVIPFIEPPIQMCFKNNRSALGNEEFVSQAISDLIKSGYGHVSC